MENADTATVAGFGDEWSRFDQSAAEARVDLDRVFEQYFETFPWADLPENAVGFDMGCGSGRWAHYVAARVGHLHCIDASADALAVARRNLADAANVTFHHASVGEPTIPAGSADFGYSLGVLHHVPDTLAGLRACAALLKPGAPFLVYLYYAFDNRPRWFRGVWKASDLVRRGVSRLPHRARAGVADGLAVGVYWPLARTARALERVGFAVDGLPLAAYRDRSLYSMRTDALDRFGTRLEQRFTRAQIAAMMEEAGFRDVVFGTYPHWCATGRRV